MKKWMVPVLAILLLTACGSDEPVKMPDVDLDDFYESLAKEYQWDNGYMVDVEDEQLNDWYPGLRDLHPEQVEAHMPMMSSVVNEVVFVECETEQDAENAAAILQERIDLQAEGGAWYPESMEAWRRGIVIQQGTYVAMIASAEHQDEIAEAFTNLFL
ncbi:MAG: DUF4358 domain-containing protein [Oscillibacter sp.]|nr:DUF4358 domain-containing protein [Oscillibacter sp.]